MRGGGSRGSAAAALAAHDEEGAEHRQDERKHEHGQIDHDVGGCGEAGRRGGEMADLGEQIFAMPVRIGFPVGVGGLVDVVHSPAFATGVGLVLYGARIADQRSLGTPQKGHSLFERVRARMAEWFSEHF